MLQMQLVTHRTDQSKLFLLIVLLQYAQAVLCLALRGFGMLCPDSDSLRRARAGHVLRRFRPSPGNRRAGPAFR